MKIEKKKIVKHLNGKPYALVPTPLIEALESVQQIKSCCNDPEIYDWLFKEMLDGKTYTDQHASGFLEYAKNSWKDQTAFINILTTYDDEVVGCISVKDANKEAAEVGYWVRHEHRGLATNALVALKGMAAEAGFRRLFAQTKPGNNKSIKCLMNAGFVLGQWYNRDKDCNKAFVTHLPDWNESRMNKEFSQSEKRIFLYRHGPAFSQHEKAPNQWKLCITATDEKYLSHLLYEMSLLDDCYYVKMSPKDSPKSRDGMMLGRVFMTTKERACELWKALYSDRKLMCSVQDDDAMETYRRRDS